MLKTIENVFEIIRNGASIKQFNGAKGIPITRIETISKNEVDREKMGYADIYDDKYSNYYLKTGDILMSHINSGEHLGKVALCNINENEKIIHGMNLLMLRNNVQEVDSEYAYYYFQSMYFKTQLKTITKQSVNQASFTVSALKKLYIPIVELDDQKSIARRLNQIRNIILIKESQLIYLDKLIQSKYNEMFGSINLPHNSSVSIKDVAVVISGSTPKTNVPEYWGETYRWITPAEIGKDDYIITDTNRHLTEDGIKSCSLKLLPKGTVLFSSRAPIGKVALVGEEMYCNQGFKNLVCSDSILPTYLYVVLKYNTEYLQSLGRGATFKEVSKQIVENIPIKVPKLEEQKKFVEFFNHIKNLESDIKHSIKQLETLKKAQMQKYFG